jgi:hypothetical protein
MRVHVVSWLLLLILLIPGVALAAPFLITNPDPGATSFSVSGLPSGFAVTGTPDPAGVYGLKTDVSALPVGSYTITATACLTDPVWGVKCSAPSAPFSFVVPAAPAIPSGLGVAIK